MDDFVDNTFFGDGSFTQTYCVTFLPIHTAFTQPYFESFLPIHTLFPYRPNFILMTRELVLNKKAINVFMPYKI